MSMSRKLLKCDKIGYEQYLAMAKKRRRKRGGSRKSSSGLSDGVKQSILAIGFAA